MAFLSPAMIAFFGFKYRWASALYIYWLATNVFTVAQQFYMFRRYGLIGPNKAAALVLPPLPPDPPSAAQKAIDTKKMAAATNGKRAYRPKKRARR
jgi:membrane protein insertase Oxa1/YidC/SpoIIIJ